MKSNPRDRKKKKEKKSHIFFSFFYATHKFFVEFQNIFYMGNTIFEVIYYLLIFLWLFYMSERSAGGYLLKGVEGTDRDR